MTAAVSCPRCGKAARGVPQPRHKVVCGDSTDPKTFELLLGDERIQMVWTDPPYGVKYVGSDNSREMIQNDDLDEAGLLDLLQRAFGLAVQHCRLGAAWYVAAPSGPKMYAFCAALHKLGIWRQTLAWVKQSLVLGHSDFHYRHEAVFYGWVPGAAHYWCGRRDLDSVNEVDRPSRSSEHPTMKPVALVAQHIECSSERGWLVCDPFSGSGTTLIACAQTGRTARCAELDPKYVDVIRRRFTRLAAEQGIAAGSGALT